MTKSRTAIFFRCSALCTAGVAALGLIGACSDNDNNVSENEAGTGGTGGGATGGTGGSRGGAGGAQGGSGGALQGGAGGAQAGAGGARGGAGGAQGGSGGALGGTGGVTDAGASDAGGVQLRVKRTDLTSDQAAVAAHTDPNLVNAWGLAVNPQAAGGPAFWVSSAEKGVSVVYDDTGTVLPVVVTIPTPGDAAAGSSPTGQAFNATTANFMGDKFIFATEQGVIAGWQTGTDAAVRVDDSGEGAKYKGLALVGTGATAMLLVTDFSAGKVAAYGTDYVEKESTAAFVDTTLPAGYAPFGVAALGGSVYVTYAKQDADKEDDVAGVGNGFVDVFNTDGSGVKRLVSGGTLNSPWGLAIAPTSFGDLAGALLVGNFGDGFIYAYDRTTGAPRGQLVDGAGAPLQIDGLWALVVGPTTGTSNLSQTVFFTAGPAGETHGLFGKLEVGD